MTDGGGEDDSVFEHVLTMDERGCRHTVCSAPVKHVFYTSKTGYVGVCRFHEDVYEEDIREDGGVRGRQEIQEKKEEISKIVSEYEDEDLENNPLNQALHQQGISYLEALEWVLGEVDDL